MDNPRQLAFQQLRPPCVELSSVALKFRARQASIISVTHALDEVYALLQGLGRDDGLDEKLAEYAFFPLTHIFNESQRLSSRCLEIAVNSLRILVSQGWRHKLAPEMAKQLLILMGLLVGGTPLTTRKEVPTDDLKIASYSCMAAIAKYLGQSSAGRAIFNEVGTMTIVDQSVYLLLEAITESPSDYVQIAAAKALEQLQSQISDRVVLASLLPRSVSALTKALQPATGARRTFRVLQTNLALLTTTLRSVLNDAVALPPRDHALASIVHREGAQERGTTTLDHSWLKATSSQVKLALANVIKLRNHERHEVRVALKDLCVMVLEDCPKVLSESVSLVVETLLVLANDSDMVETYATLKYLATTQPELVDLLSSSLHKWIGALPRLMQGNDDRPKQRILKQIATTFQILSDIDHSSMLLDDSLGKSLVESVVAAEQTINAKRSAVITETKISPTHVISVKDFQTESQTTPILFAHRSQEDSATEMRTLIKRLQTMQGYDVLVRSIINHIPNGALLSKTAAIWLALSFLQPEALDQISVDDLLAWPHDLTPGQNSRACLISDLYSMTLPLLLESPEAVDDWRPTALAMQSLVLQANQLGSEYQTELIDTLYPVLSLLGSSQSDLRNHAVTTLNHLAKACQYSSTADMLVLNVDYLVNSIALKLNTFDLSPQAPQVLLMMIRLCGARLLPYMDDLIGSIFTALDTFHGYPTLVETLFAVLGAVVNESARRPTLSITAEKEAPIHKKEYFKASILEDILADVGRRTQLESQSDNKGSEANHKAPHRPWTTQLDGPRVAGSTASADENGMREHDEDAGLPPAAHEDEKEKPLSKPHQLLLSIAQSTAPHLSSPSPRVRLILLQLLSNIAHLLAHDENSFLPFINAIWPAIVPRLFGEVTEEGQSDPGYVVAAATETISALCIGAGDFMTSRIEQVFPRLQNLYYQVWRRVSTHRSKNMLKKTQSQSDASSISGAVDLRIMKSNPETTTTVDSTPQSVSSSFQDHTADYQVLKGLIGLLGTIISYVHVTEDIGESILEMLLPIMDDPGRKGVRGALETWNADALWALQQDLRLA